MKQFLYPAVFYRGDIDENQYFAFFPDLNLVTDGTSFEEAYLFAKDYLRLFFEKTLKFELEFELPSKYELIQNKFPKTNVMLVETVIDTKQI